MKIIKPRLSAPQRVFLETLPTKFRGFIGGYGSGKTFVGCLDLLNFFLAHPKTIQGYFGITYPSIRDVFYPTFEEAAEMLGLNVIVRKGDKEVDVYKGRKYIGTVICRSMDTPSSIVGFKIARALVDEIDILPVNKANDAWNKIIARMRLSIDGVVNSIGVTTTPEGFMFVYQKFAENPTESYSMVQASTYENQLYVPDDYIDSLKETYSGELVEAYVYGNFVNLKSGTVYNAYNRKTHNSLASIKEKEPLYIGMDFNVTNMSAVVYVKRQDVDARNRPVGKEQWHAVEELTKIYDTPAIIKTINQKYPNHHISIYPDASGASRKSNDASNTDISLLEKEFNVVAPKKNPFVKDRVLSTNKAFNNGVLFINSLTCKEYAKCMEQLAYDVNGEPDKSSGIDHLPDAGTYPIAYEMPVIKPVANINIKYSR